MFNLAVKDPFVGLVILPLRKPISLQSRSLTVSISLEMDASSNAGILKVLHFASHQASKLLETMRFAQLHLSELHCPVAYAILAMIALLTALTSNTSNLLPSHVLSGLGMASSATQDCRIFAFPIVCVSLELNASMDALTYVKSSSDNHRISKPLVAMHFVSLRWSIS